MEPWSFPVTHQEDEDQVGQLQPRCRPQLAQLGTGQDAAAVHRVHRRARAGASAGAPARRPLVALLDRVMPQWQQCRAELNQVPLGHEEW